MARKALGRTLLGKAPRKPVARALPRVDEDRVEGAEKDRVCLYLSAALLQRLRSAAHQIPGATMSGLAEEAIRDHLQGLERTSGPFEGAPRRLSPGRPPRAE